MTDELTIDNKTYYVNLDTISWPKENSSRPYPEVWLTTLGLVKFMLISSMKQKRIPLYLVHNERPYMATSGSNLFWMAAAA